MNIQIVNNYFHKKLDLSELNSYLCQTQLKKLKL